MKWGEKMISFMNTARILLAKLLSSLYVITTVFAGVPVNVKEPTKTPDNFEPVIRFAVCSDVHLNGEDDQAEAKRLEKLINFMYDYSADKSYKNFDALCMVGDTCNTGKEIEYDKLNEILDNNLRDETKLLICTGNHEYINTRDYDASLSARLFESKMNRALDTHTEINGYHFVLASYSDDGKTFKSKLNWLDDEITKAEKASGDKPVFVFQHPAPFATVYGSINWGDFDIPRVLLKHPRVIDFSGHSHYPVNDPRSMWQGGYTALGCGTLSYFETELDGIAGNFPYDNENAAQFYIVECDKAGNTRILSYDLITDTFFDNEYYLTNLAKRNFEYSYAKMKVRDKAPEWKADTKITTTKNEKGETLLIFEGASDKYIVESYKVNVSEGAKSVMSDNFSGKYMYLYEENIYDVNLGKLTAGKTYSVQIIALNAYAETSKALNYKFTAE